MNEIKEYTEKIFEDLKHIDENGNEYWLTRELQGVLEYKRWDKFLNAINREKTACNNSDYDITDHFLQVEKMVVIGSGAKRNQIKMYSLIKSM